MGVENVRDDMLGEVGGEIIHDYCGVGRVNEHQALVGGAGNDVGVVIFEEGQRDDPIVSFERLHEVLLCY